jgi:hypothetical protein
MLLARPIITAREALYLNQSLTDSVEERVITVHLVVLGNAKSELLKTT